MSTEKNSYVTENGITLGIVILALFVIFGVGLPRWFSDDAASASSSSSSSAPLELPSKLSGGFVQDSSKRAAAGAENRSKEMTSGLGTSAVVGVYLKGKQDSILVQAARGDNDVPLDPTAASSFKKVGDDVCGNGQSQTLGSYAYCVNSSDGVVVQVTGRDAETASTYADEIHAKLV